MEYNFFDVRVGTRTRAGNLNTLHSFVCKSTEIHDFIVRDYYQNRYIGLSIDVFKIQEVFDISKEVIQNNDTFEVKKNESINKIRDLEREIKNLRESKNSQFYMEIDDVDINEENQLLYKKVNEDYLVYTKSIVDLENGIKKQIMEKYKPFASSITIDQRMSGSNRTMKFKLNLKAKLF